MARPFEKYFYHQSLEKYISLFNMIMADIKIVTEAGSMKVPLHVANGRRNDMDRNVPSNMLPFATMGMGGFDINKQVTNSFHNKLSTSTARSKQRIPVIIEFEYNVRTKKLHEMLQIIEQIYSVFTPSIDCIIKDNETLAQDQNVKLKLLSHSLTDNWESSDGNDSFHVDCNFQFELHGSIYGYDEWVQGDGSDGDGGPKIAQVIVDMSTDMSLAWTELPEWFMVDAQGVHHPEEK